MAIPDSPTATPQKARAMMRALGIRPEENELQPLLMLFWDVSGLAKCDTPARIWVF